MAAAGIGQAHRALYAGHQADGICGAFLAGQGDGFRCGGLLALGVLGAGGGVDVKVDVLQLGSCEIRVEADAERQDFVAGVVHGQFQPGLGTGQGIAHFQQKIKGVNKLGQAVGGQGQHDLIIRSGLDLPGQQIGKAVDLNGIIGAVKVVHTAIRLAAAGEQDGHAAAGAVRGFIVLIAQPEVFLTAFGEGGCHAALFRCNGQGVLPIGQGKGGIFGIVLFVSTGSQLGHCYSPLSSVTKTARPHRDSWSSAQRLDPRAPGTPGAVPFCAPQADTAPGRHFLIPLYSQNVPGSTLLGKKCGGSQSISAKITAQRHP